MAQKTDNEEEFKVVPESVALCVKCGVAGVSTANNMCRKCVNGMAAVSTSVAASVLSGGGTKPVNHVFVDESFRSSSAGRSSLERDSIPAEISEDLVKEASVEPEAIPPVKREVNRCSGCRRKVGLTGFRCRCGEFFCSDHRYSDRHDCSYDYKAAGREAIARENPVVKAAKIVRI